MILRIELAVGEKEYFKDGGSEFHPKFQNRIEIERNDILVEIKDYRREILRLVNNKLQELELRLNEKAVLN